MNRGAGWPTELVTKITRAQIIGRGVGGLGWGTLSSNLVRIDLANAKAHRHSLIEIGVSQKQINFDLSCGAEQLH